jgi:hypothetical protein
VFVRYDNQCTVGQTNCPVTFTLTETLPAPVYFYYGFKGFYQNHRRYLKFFSSAQLTSGDPNQSGVITLIQSYQLTAGTMLLMPRPLEQELLQELMELQPILLMAKMPFPAEL